MTGYLRGAAAGAALLALSGAGEAAAQTNGNSVVPSTRVEGQPRLESTPREARTNAVNSDVDADLRRADQDIREAEKDLARSPWLRESVRRLTDE